MAEKKSYAELGWLLAAAPLPGSLWRHFKTGDDYVVAGAAIAESTQEPLVIYRPVDAAGVHFARPLAEWEESVDVNGQAVPRFRRL